ncbi:amino acid ABC transporter ATP-binding/permease protein [Rhizobium rhizogenes]|uniref:amino acid ABC transporter ATP-binding/permease protein n=1 Tax=Rhizobium rhizogenes TaxID=359 RepID=UPI001571B394|nr:amino acid ABC transporter ATP-binding/permease protein [Rhizobium rhizogenes]NTI31114.1 amino acid ABC transporter ATP-binding/permease protein [Rhizobium rhizogenes]
MTSTFSALYPICRFFLAGRKRALLLGALLSALTVLAGIALLGLSGWFITAASLAGLTATAITFDVFAPSAGIRLLAILRTGARYGERLTTHDATLGLLAALRENLFRGWAAPGAATILMHRPAKLLFRLTADIDALDSLYLRVLVPATIAIVSGLAVSIALMLLSVPFGLLAGLWLIAAGLGIPALAGRLALKPARRRAHAIEALRSRAVDLIAGQMELVMANRLQAQCTAIAAADHRLSKADDILNRIESGVTVGFGLASAALLSGTLLTVTSLAERGIIGAPVAACGLLMALAALEPFAVLRRGALELGRTMLAARRLSPRLVQVSHSPAHQMPPDGLAVRLSSVSARYEGAAVASLEDISLSLALGEHLAVIGPSGAGKSTLFAILAGELAAESGTVETVMASTLTQRTELFQDSLRDNLRLAASEANDDMLYSALADAGLLADVQALPKGIDTRLGEGGLGLSGGQSRRLALARLFLRGTKLWLLDEPTEGLDRETGRDVMRRLASRSRGRSLVIATHIRREAEIADRIVVLDKGHIVVTARRGETEFDTALARLRQD